MSLSKMRTRSNADKDVKLSDILDAGLSIPTLKIETPALTKKLLQSSTSEQQQAVSIRFKEKYAGQEPKTIQINTTVSLINGDDTFLLAGTGFGKSRVPELFFHMFAKARKPVVLVLNPLDALGNNQVLEKGRIGISAINLTKTTFTSEVLAKLKEHAYSFIYLSPEIFLNSEAFQSLYHSKEFQRHLILKVIDEAHCIYLWGLQASGKLRRMSKHVIPEDVGQFRVSYGDLGDQIMATDGVPTLLMSATCRPFAIAAIQSSLKITPKRMTMVQGELTRPENRFIRMYLTRPLNSAEDIASLFAPSTVVSNDEMIPTLIYSGTRNATGVVIDVVCKSRGTPEDACNGNSTLIRRYHSVTGEQDQLTRVQDYGDAKFPIMSCTSALGLGQNWPRVKIVIILGAMDPAESNQMAGRAGRGREGEDGLVIHLVQPTMTPGKNSLDDFKASGNMDDEDRMHALRVTPCCLRVAYSVDNLRGYIPVDLLDPGYLTEKAREDALKMRPCRCSQCDPQGCAHLIRLLPFTKAENFDRLMKSSPNQPEDVSRFAMPKKMTKRKFSGNIPQACKFNDPIRLSIPLIDLVVILMGKFETLFVQQYPTGSHMMPGELFDREDAWQIVKNYEAVHNGIFLREILGGEALPGQFALVRECIQLWLQSPVYHQHQQALEDEQIRHDQEILDKDLIEEEHQAQMRLKQIARDIKKAGIAERKRLRLQREIEKQVAKENKQKARQEELSIEIPK